MPQDDPDKIDLNLDEEPLGESPLDAAALAALKAVTAAERPAAAPAPAEAPAATPELDPQALADKVATLLAEKDDLTNTLIRRQADFENYRKRIERERKEDGHRFAAMLIETLLPVIDGFERALATPYPKEDPAYEEHRKGFDLICRQLWDALGRYDLQRIEALGKPFDPHLHQAIERVESPEHEEGTVLEEFQRGYTLRGKVLRPSMVRVSSKPARSGPAPEPNAKSQPEPEPPAK